ncbi:cadherin-like domain-containing protein [uncultured Roseibium sp.]|uniref:cadherin-like domain-containing protein n=1 Tax=uncultured Roseibium sp. TaxID=1936171 RepID=UPI003748B854
MLSPALRTLPITGNVLVDNGAGADGDIDGDTLTVTAGTFATAGGGSVTIDANGSFTYIPAPDFNGSDSFTYSVSDGTAVDTGTVYLSVGATDDAPVAVADNFTVDEDSGATVFDVLANDTDTDGGLIAIQSVTPTNRRHGYHRHTAAPMSASRRMPTSTVRPASPTR